MKRYSQFIILSMGVFAMKIEIISVSTILHATSFRDYFDTTVYTLMLLFFLLIFAFVNVCIIGEYISTVKNGISETSILPVQETKAWGRTSITQYSAIASGRVDQFRKIRYGANPHAENIKAF